MESSPKAWHHRASQESEVEGQKFRATSSLIPVFAKARLWSSSNPTLDDLVLTNEELEKVLSDQVLLPVNCNSLLPT